jgi:hypothetical protein
MARLKAKNRPTVVAGSGTANTSWGRPGGMRETVSRADNEKQQLQRATRRLAALLIEATPLIEQLNSSDTPHEFRAALTELVGMRRYITAMFGLQQMSCRAAWDKAHPSRRRAEDPPRPDLSRLGVGAVVPIPRR